MSPKNETQNTPQQPPAAANPNKGATFVKHGLLAKPLIAPIAAVRPGNFGKTDIEVQSGGRRFIVSLGPTNPQFAALTDAFGAPSDWVGCTIKVSDDQTVRQVNVAAVSTRDGKPVPQ